MHLKSLAAPKPAPQTLVSAVATAAAAKRRTQADVFSNFFSPLVALIPTPRAGASPASLGPRLRDAALQRFSTAEEHRAPPSGAKAAGVAQSVTLASRCAGDRLRADRYLTV